MRHKLRDFVTFNPFLPSGLFHPKAYQLKESISKFRGVWCIIFLFLLFQIEIPVGKQWSLIWVYTVCLGPKNGTLSIKGFKIGLNFVNHFGD